VARRRAGSAAVPCSAAGWLARADAAARQACCAARATAAAQPLADAGSDGRFYSALPRHGSGRGTAAPRSVARQSPVTSAVNASGRRHVSPLPHHRHLAASGAIGVTKSVSLKNR